MNVRLDQPGTDEASPRIVGFAFRGKRALYGDDAPVVCPDVKSAVRNAIGKPRIAQDELHVRATRP
jgi:hypothetical protein